MENIDKVYHKVLSAINYSKTVNTELPKNKSAKKFAREVLNRELYNAVVFLKNLGYNAKRVNVQRLLKFEHNKWEERNRFKATFRSIHFYHVSDLLSGQVYIRKDEYTALAVPLNTVNGIEVFLLENIE